VDSLACFGHGFYLKQRLEKKKRKKKEINKDQMQQNKTMSTIVQVDVLLVLVLIMKNRIVLTHLKIAGMNRPLLNGLVILLGMRFCVCSLSTYSHG
jgi:p-aminobenzoyl-glutamate transporter AbgT